MKRLFAILALIAAALSSCGNAEPGGGTGTIDISSGVICDELFSYDEDNVGLLIFRCGDSYFSRVGGDVMSLKIQGDIPGGMELPDGGFAVITADITRLSGGIAGFAGNPEIRRLRSFEAIGFEEAAQKYGFEEYTLGEEKYSQPQICVSGGNTYCVLFFYDGVHIYLDGSAVGVYETLFEAEAAMGLRTNADTLAELEKVTCMALYVFRCGDTYLAYSTNIYMNRYWTPLLNAQYENAPSGFELADGEVAVIYDPDLLKVNGGEKGYVNAPMLVSPAEAEKCGYITLTLNTAPEHWEESVPTAEGEMRQYSAGDWLIFLLGGKYHVYHDTFPEHELIGIFDTADEVDTALGR